MRSYRLLFLDKTGHLIGNKTIDCMEDREAIAIAEREVRRCEYVEVWNGGRPLCICARPLKQPSRLARFLRSQRRGRWPFRLQLSATTFGAAPDLMMTPTSARQARRW